MSTPHCPKCGAATALLFKTQDHNRRLSREDFDYFRCDGCHFIFLSPIPSDLGRYYPTDYYAVPRNEAELAATAESLQSSKLELVQRFAKKGRLLEIGSAYGLFAFLAKRAGFEVTAIEMDRRCCQFLRDTVGITVIEGADTVGLMHNLPKFDVIVLWQVIEHLRDPWALMAAAARSLNANGVLIVDTPNPDAFQFRILGSRWTHVDAPRHVTLIPADLMSQSARELGLERIWQSADSAISRGYNGFGWAHSLKSFFRNETLGRGAFFLGRVITKLLIPIERTGWRGSTYTAVFKKGPTA